MYEYLRRSDAGWRKTETKYEKEQKSLEGYEPSTEEKNKNKEPQQRLRMENAYGRITLGKNEDGEMTFVVTGKKSLQGKPAEQNEKVLVKDRAVRRREGVFTEHREGVTKTLTYKQDIQTKYKKEVMLQRIQKTLEEEPSEMVMAQMPFLSVRKDQKKLKEIEQQEKEMRSIPKEEKNKEEKNEEKLNLNREKTQLEQEIQIKKNVRRELMKSLTAAMKDKEETKNTTDRDFRGIWQLSYLGTDAPPAATDGAPNEDDEDEEDSIKSKK